MGKFLISEKKIFCQAGFSLLVSKLNKRMVELLAEVSSYIMTQTSLSK